MWTVGLFTFRVIARRYAASAFPASGVHEGWHAAVFDTNGDGDLDIFLGGWQGPLLPPYIWFILKAYTARWIVEETIPGSIPDDVMTSSDFDKEAVCAPV